MVHVATRLASALTKALGGDLIETFERALAIISVSTLPTQSAFRTRDAAALMKLHACLLATSLALPLPLQRCSVSSNDVLPVRPIVVWLGKGCLSRLSIAYPLLGAFTFDVTHQATAANLQGCFGHDLCTVIIAVF